MNRLIFLFCFCFCTACAFSQSVTFTYNTASGLFCSPATIQFTQNSTGSPVGYIWNFGNGAKSHSPNPSTVYSKAGTYNVSLTVIYPGSVVKISNAIVINQTPNPFFTSDKNALCQPGTINFSTSPNNNISSYDWDFGDGSVTSTISTSISHFYATYGTFKVTLNAKNVSGCDSLDSATITISPVPIAATLSAAGGCIPAQVNFNANVTLLPQDGVKNYVWDFGDGGAPVSTLTKNISHTYLATGKYFPSLTVTTNDGCNNVYNFDSVAYGTPPTNLIAYTPKNVICGSEKAVLVAKATSANYYVWDYGGSISTVTDTITKHQYGSLGTHTVVVTPFFNGCAGKADSFDITVVGVIAKFTFANTCDDRKTFSFKNRSLGNVTSTTWDFGDGTSTTNTLNPVHTFPASGIFPVSLIISDSITGCSDTLSQEVRTSTASLVNPDKSVCRFGASTFTVLNYFGDTSTIYRYFVLGKSIGSKDTLVVKADTFGIYDNFVVIKNGSSYCQDTLYLNHQIVVKGPLADFTSVDSFCLSTPLIVTNNTKPFVPGENIVSWDWDFGDGSVHDSTFQPQPHQYANPGDYKIFLTATDADGCTDVFRKNIRVSEDAFIYTFPKTDTLCLGQPKTLIAFQDDSVLWSPANRVSCATCDTVQVNPVKNTTFYATSTNAFGCTATDSVSVKVYLPFTATTSASDLYICLGESGPLDVSPPGYKIMWSPPNGLSDPNIYTPVAMPSATTTYTATLSDSVGCFTSSVDVNVHLKTQPSVDAGPDQFYPYNSSFTISPIYSGNIVSYLWTPSNQLTCTTCASPSGTILQKQTYAIQVTSDSGCVSKDSVTIFVECKDANLLLPNAFTPNNDNLNDVYYPFGQGIQTITNFSIYNREGHLVFQKKNFPPNDKTFGWDGSFKGAKYSTAIFVYILEALCDSGERLSKKGSVTLIR